MRLNKPETAQVGDPLTLQRTKFLKYAKDNIVKILSISVPKNTLRDTHKTRKQLLPSGNTKKTFKINFCWEKVTVPRKKKEALSSQNVFLKPRTFMKVKGYTLTKQKIFEVALPYLNSVFVVTSTMTEKTLIRSIGPKITNEVTLWTPKVFSSQKISKKNQKSENFGGKTFHDFF